MRTSPLFSSFFLHPSLHLPTTSPFSLRLAILDEATSALDLTNEGVMYNALQKIPGLTYLSVGHRPSLLRFHARRLRLHGMQESDEEGGEGGAHKEWKSYELEVIDIESAEAAALKESMESVAK